MNKNIIHQPNLLFNKDDLLNQRFKQYLLSLHEVRERSLDIGNATFEKGPKKNDYYPDDVTYKSV